MCSSVVTYKLFMKNDYSVTANIALTVLKNNVVQTSYTLSKKLFAEALKIATYNFYRTLYCSKNIFLVKSTCYK